MRQARLALLCALAAEDLRLPRGGGEPARSLLPHAANLGLPPERPEQLLLGEPPVPVRALRSGRGRGRSGRRDALSVALLAGGLLSGNGARGGADPRQLGVTVGLHLELRKEGPCGMRLFVQVICMHLDVCYACVYMYTMGHACHVYM